MTPDLYELDAFAAVARHRSFRKAAAERGIALEKEEARQKVYGMPTEEWKAKHQTEITPEQKAAFAAAKKHD